MSSWATNPFNPNRLPNRITPDMLIMDRNGITGQPLRPGDDQPDDGTATNNIGVPNAGTSAPFDLGSLPQPRIRPTPPPQPQPAPEMPPPVTPRVAGGYGQSVQSGPNEEMPQEMTPQRLAGGGRSTISQPAFEGRPDMTPRGIAIQGAEAPFTGPPRPEQPKTWRSILAALAGSTNIGRNFAPLIAYGPKGLQQERAYEDYQQSLPGKLEGSRTAAGVYGTDANEKLREATQQQTQTYQKGEQDRKLDEELQKFTSAPNYGQLVDVGKPLPEGYTRAAGYAPPGQYRAQPTPGKVKQLEMEAKQVGDIEVPEDIIKALKLPPGLKASPDILKAYNESVRALRETRQPEGELPLGPRVKQINKALSARYQVLHPGAQLPEHYLLPENATQKDFDRTDKLIEGEERAFGTKENQEQTRELRKQTLALAQGNREKKDETALKTAGLKAYAPAMDSSERFNVMTKNYEDAVKSHDQQAMLSLLANHLGMTMGLQKGSRLTRDIIREAQQSRPWLQGFTTKFDSQGYLSGVTLTPQQMHQMVSLGRERFAEDISKARNEAQYQGVGDDGPKRTPSKATINFYTALGGGDPKKAKELAAADGWSIQ